MPYNTAYDIIETKKAGDVSVVLTMILKKMKNERQYYGKINEHDMISYNRSGGYHAVTIHYNIGTKKRRTEGFDSHVWQEIEDFLRKRFDYYCQRKDG